MPRPKNLELPSLIKLTRMREGLRQIDLAKAVRVSRDTLGRYESGRARTPEDTANLIAVALGLKDAERTAFLAAWQHDRRLWDGVAADKAADRSRHKQAKPLEPVVLPDIGPIDIPGGRTRILTKIAHSIIKPLRKPLYEVGRSACNEDKCCMNFTKYTLKRLLSALKHFKPCEFLETKSAMSYFCQDPSPTSPGSDTTEQADIPIPDTVSDSVPYVEADRWTPTWIGATAGMPAYIRGSATPPPGPPPINIHVNAPPPPQSRYTLRSRGGLLLLGFLVLAVVGAGAWWGLSAIRPSPVALVHVTSTPAPTAPATHALPTATATPGITPAATATPIPTPGDTPTAIVIPTTGPTPPAVTAAAAGSWRVQLDAPCKWSVWLSATGLQPGSTVTLDDPSYTATDCSGKTFRSGWPHPNDSGTADANGEWGAYGIVQPNWGTYHYVVADAAGNVVNIDVVYDQNAGA